MYFLSDWGSRNVTTHNGRNTHEVLHRAKVRVNWKGLGEEISDTLLNAEQTLADTIAQPVKPHVNRLGTGDLEGVVGQTDATCVIAEKDCWGLGMTECSSYNTNPNSLALSEISGTVFSLCRRRDDKVEIAKTGPLKGKGASFQPKKAWMPTRLRARYSVR
jgi:hypothetical protein